jgi:uridine kinase
MKPHRKPVIVAVVGPTCCGKTTECNKLKKALGAECKVLSQDNFYHSADEFSNFDKPSAIDFRRLKETIKQLKEGESVMIPKYDFVTHKRLAEEIPFGPAAVILVEGILLFCDEELVKMFDIKVYIKSDSSERHKRRLNRDTKERGRTAESVERQYREHVMPSNREYVEPSQKFADHMLIDNSDFTFQGEAELLTNINKMVGFVVE